MSKSAASPVPLRIGLLIDDFDLPAWQYELLQQLQQEDWIDVALVVKRQSELRRQRPVQQRLVSLSKQLLLQLYTRTDEALFQRQCQPSAFSRKDSKPVLSDVPVIQVVPRETKFSDYFSDQDASAVQEHKIDVLLRWGFRILRGHILSAAKYGIWSFHHGDNRVNRGTMPGLWEVIEGMHTTGSILQILSEQLDGGQVIDRFVGATEKTSVTKNKHNLYWRTASMLLPNLKRLHRDRDGFMKRRAEKFATNDVPAPYCHPLRKQPTNWQMVKGIARILAFAFNEKARHVLHYDQWFLAYRMGKDQNDPNDALYQYKVILPPKETFWADPFVVERDKKYYVFFEELPFATHRAHISVLEIDNNGVWSSARPVIQQPYHMSYPFVFEDQGELYMIPETGENRTIEMYRCTEFPDKWEFDTVLMSDIRAVDTTLHFQDDKWWMFVSLAEKNLRNRDSCHIFFSENFRGPWTPHPENPIKLDVENARMGGHFFRRNGKLYRPAQNCGERYGRSLKINEVLELNENQYRERLVAEISPDWDPMMLGTHTLNRAGRLTVIDGEMLRSRFF